jgi:hypothetical protein
MPQQNLVDRVNEEERKVALEVAAFQQNWQKTHKWWSIS